MADTANLLKGVLGIAQQFQAASITQSAAASQANTIRVGGEIAASGAMLSAEGFRESAKAVQGATSFNLQIDRINEQRKLSSVSRQFQRTLSKQLVGAAGSGISVGSKSFLQLRNETLDVFDRTLLNLKIDAENQRRSRTFESAVKLTNLENQARASEFRAAAERVTASNRASEALFQGEIAGLKARQSGLKALPTLLSQAFQS